MNAGHILITGASGFIGCACLREFIARNWHVTALINKTLPAEFEELARKKQLNILKVSLADRKALTDEISKLNKSAPLDCIFHAAGKVIDIGAEREFREANFNTTVNLIDLSVELNIGKLIYVSTTDVYGIKDFKNADEGTPYDNNRCNYYPHFKIQAEKYLKEKLPASRYVIIRPAAVWGPGDNTILPRVADFLRKSPFLVNFGKWKGRNRWPLAYVGNLAKTVYWAAATDSVNGEALNIADSEVTSFEEYQRMVLGIFFPEKKNMKALNIPDFPAIYLARLSTMLSNFFRLRKPLWEPTYYGYCSIAANLDFSNEKMLRLLKENGDSAFTKEEAFETVKRYYSGIS